MVNTINARVTGRIEGEFVVFLIGMRVNRWWKLGKVLMVARAMNPMIRELMAHPELGCLGAEPAFGRTTIMVTYWRSMEPAPRLRDQRHSRALARVERVQQGDRHQRRRRHLARGLPVARRRLRNDVRQHAALRVGQGGAHRAGGRPLCARGRAARRERRSGVAHPACDLVAKSPAQSSGHFSVYK